MAGNLVGKIAFITGAGSGIGRATCKILAREGASIIAVDKNVDNVEATIKEIPKNSNQIHSSFGLDVANQRNIKDTLSQIINQYKTPPSIIVNSAGVTRDNFLLKLSEDDFDEVISINLKGTFSVIQIFSNAIVENEIKGASIINIASIVGKYGNMGQSNYSASKAGVEALTKTAAKEFGKFGIRVNCILPGFIKTPMTDAIPDKLKEKVLGAIPMGRMGHPEEVAEVIAFLASDKSSYVHGASIDITGGF